MAWIILVLAGIFETGWAIGLKYSHGFTRLWPSIFTIVMFILSVGLLAYSVKTLPIGTAYAVWVGIGAVGAVILGIVLFKEPATIPRMLFLGLMLVSIVGLKLTAQ